MEALGRDYPMDEAVIISAVRTPIGKYGKALAGFKATELGSMVVKEAVSRAGLQPTDIQECIKIGRAHV